MIYEIQLYEDAEIMLAIHNLYHMSFMEHIASVNDMSLPLAYCLKTLTCNKIVSKLNYLFKGSSIYRRDTITDC
jgi:hypothetical protein